MKYFLILLFILFFFSGRAQGNFTIVGNVIDQRTRQPMEFVNVFLLKTSDSAVVSGTITNEKGNFRLDSVSDGAFILQLSFIGYNKKEFPVVVSTQVPRMNIGQVELAMDAKNLQEVEVSADKSLTNMSIDRKIYNVGQDIQSTTGSASDVLRNIPSVEVSLEGDVSLRGAGVMFLINGKPSVLMGKNAAEVLQQIPAALIERIEVITNPSAKYKPDGVSGIINIVMKKNAQQGLNGSVTVSAGTDDRYNGSTLLNYKKGKVNMTVNYGIRRDFRQRNSNTDRTYLVSDAYTRYIQADDVGGHPLSHRASAGLEYEMNDKNTLSLSGNYMYRKSDYTSLSDRTYFIGDAIATDVEVAGNRNFHEDEGEISLNYGHTFNKKDHELQVEVLHSFDTEYQNQFNTYNYTQPVFLTFDKYNMVKSDEPTEVSVDYTNPLSEDAELEAGYAGSFNRIILDFNAQAFDPSFQGFYNDTARTNIFEYNDAVHAIYSTYSNSIDQFGYKIGLRAEQAYLHGDVKNINTTFNNDYFSVYPTVHLSYDMEKTGELQLNYSRRVNRPDGDELNPKSESDDPRNLQAGNPNLLPEYIHSIEFGYRYQNQKFSIMPSIFYRYRYNGFTEVTYALNDSTLLTTQQNLSTDQSGGVEVVLSGNPSKWITGSLTTTLFYNEIDASNLGYSKKKSINTMSINLNTTLTLAANTRMQFTYYYRSTRLTPQGRMYPMSSLNSGIRQDILKRKGALTLTISDVFKSWQHKMTIDNAQLSQTSVSKRNSRVVFLGFSYRFGQTMKKQREELMQFDREQ